MARALAFRLIPVALPASPPPRGLLAHDGAPVQPHDLWGAWSLEPGVLLALALAAGCYVRGTRALWRRAGVGRGVRLWQATSFAGGMAALALALVTPLHALGEALFAAHMVQHLLLVLIVAPLLALSAPVPAALWALPSRARRALARRWRCAHRLRAAGRALTHPLAAWILATVTLWAWHLPRAYDAAVRHDAIHSLEHASFLASALLFWWALVRPAGTFRRARGAALLYLFAAGVQGTMLGALLALASRPWYAAHLTTTRPWGLSPLEDQHLGGAIMWMPAGVIYLVALAGALAAWLRDAEREVERRERLRSGAGRTELPTG
ncbi:MAG TPA: cytochrome c oxidase assembly protein [Longimicrobiales bacterium]